MEQPVGGTVPIRPDAEAYAREWTRACAGISGYLPRGPEQTEHLLYELTLRLLDAVEGTGSGQDVGEAMVRAHLTDPSLLDRTVQLLGTEFARMFAVPPERVARVQGGLAAGYVFALRQRTLAEQEALTLAVLDARSD